MDPPVTTRRGPFVAATVALVAVCVVVIALPESFLEQLERNRPLTDAQAGWAYRLIAIVALAQVVYGGFAVFQVDRIQAVSAHDPRFATKPQAAIVRSLARTAATMVGLTLVYGIATVAITGLRGGFWLFPLVAVAQAAWYYREIGQIARWAAFQPKPRSIAVDRGAWSGHWPHHVPTLARGMTPIDDALDDAIHGDAGDR